MKMYDMSDTNASVKKMTKEKVLKHDDVMITTEAFIKYLFEGFGKWLDFRLVDANGEFVYSLYVYEPDFATYALGNLRNTKSRIESFLEDACLTYPEYDLNKYDNILEDFYNAMEHYEGATSKYYSIHYIRTNINLGICHDVDHHYSLLSDFDDEIREKDTKILDEIVELVKQLYGFKAPTDKKSNFVNYYRWNDVNEKI